MAFKIGLVAGFISALAVFGAALAAKAPPNTVTLKDGRLTVQVVDLSPRFLAFYDAAKGVPDAATRFKLWQELYGFAAVPPTPEGQAMARRLVDGAWPRYGEAVAAAQAGAAGMSPQPMAILHRVAELLGLDAPATIKLVTYVGGFEDNAFTARADLPTVAIPLEIAGPTRARSLAHEGTHALHMTIDNLSGGWERSVAATMLQEGLAMQVSRAALPGATLEAYVSNRPGWWQQCQAKDRAILMVLREKLARSDSETVASVTILKGPKAGIEREAYYGGWRVVERMRANGMTFAQIARIPEAEMPARVGEVLDQLLAAPPA
ncbi:MAG: hypothetical protein ACXU8Z_21575 [Caulobacteraceae bacterium]